MDVVIQLTDLLDRLRIIPYINYKIETKGTAAFITLITREDSTQYQIIKEISNADLTLLEDQLKRNKR